MVNPVGSNVTYQPITEEVQNLTIALVTQKTKGIAMDVLRVLINTQTIEPQEFVSKIITPRQKELGELDERAVKLMQNIVDSVNEVINMLPGSGMAMTFSKLAQHTGDPQIRENLIRSLAVDPVKFMIQTLDTMNPEIVNRLIRPAIPEAKL